jgi:hypothetical protein
MPAPDLEDPVIGSDVELLNDRAQPISHPALETWTPDSGDAAIGERREPVEHHGPVAEFLSHLGVGLRPAAVGEPSGAA